jgi:hypothetical protein
MPFNYGSLMTLDTLAASAATVQSLGEGNVFGAIDRALTLHNALLAEKTGTLVEATTDRTRVYGTDDSMDMDEVDQHGRADSQRVGAGAEVGFPLRLYDISIQWTRKYFEVATGAEIAAQFTAAQDADVRNLDKAIRQALFRPTNYTFKDKLAPRAPDRINLAVKALVNADSASIPMGPDGIAFDGTTHTHYIGRVGGSLAATDIDALLETVLEHYRVGALMLYINRAQETTVRGFNAANQFSGYMDSRVSALSTERIALGTALDPLNIYNRAIGVYGPAEVWVKPWIPSGYMFAYLRGQPRPLALRTFNSARGSFRIVADDENYPMRARTAEREFGIGVAERTNGAILYIGGTSYVAPTIT